MSDEEDGDDDTFQSPFENFTSTAPRFSVMLGHHQLSFDEESGESGNSSMASTSSATSTLDKKRPGGSLAEPKHEKRDSGVGGMEENSGGGPEIKILEGEGPKLSLLGASSAAGAGDERVLPASGGKTGKSAAAEEQEQLEDDDDDTEEERGGGGTEKGGGDTSTEEDEEVHITNIDDVSDEEEKAPPTTVSASSTTSATGKGVPIITTSASTPPSIRATAGKTNASSSSLSRSSRDRHTTSPPATPIRPLSDYSSLVRQPDHAHSAAAAASYSRPLSEHAQSSSLPPQAGGGGGRPTPGIASRLKRREARMERAEDIALISSMAHAGHDLDITVSPPTPGQDGACACPVGQENSVLYALVLGARARLRARAHTCPTCQNKLLLLCMWRALLYFDLSPVPFQVSTTAPPVVVWRTATVP